MARHLKIEVDMANKPGRRAIGNIRQLQSGRYQLRYVDPSGLPRSGGTFSTKQTAEKELNRIQYAIENGTYYESKAVAEGTLDPKSVTLSELAEHWRATRLNSKGRPLAPKTLAEYTRYVEVELARFKDKPVRAITSGMVELWWRNPKNQAHPRQRNSVYKHLSTLMGYATDKSRRIILASPCTIENASIYSPDREPETPTLEQVEMMLENAVGPFHAFLTIAAWGGLRRGELFGLQRGDFEITDSPSGLEISINVARSVEWKTRPATFKPPKYDSYRTTVLPPRAHSSVLELLHSLPIHQTALLFPRLDGTDEIPHEGRFNSQWRRVRKAAGYGGRFHSLRSFHLTQWGLTGATAVEISARGGHKDLKTAMRYQRTTGRDSELARRLG
jgi:integrase